MNQINDKIRDILKRKRGDRIQAEMESVSGLSQKTWSNYETGARTPDFETIVDLAGKLDFSKELIDIILEQNVPEKFPNNEDVQADDKPKDYTDKYIKSLEEQVNFLQGQLRHITILTHARVATNQHVLVDLLAKQQNEEVEQVERMLSKENLQNYQKLKDELGIV